MYDNLDKKSGADKTFYLHTYGCQMNEEDSEKMAGMLEGMGYSKTEVRDEADVIIFNTCCVRENAELKVYGNLGQLKALKKQRPDLIIAISGCMMQQKGMPQEIKKKYPFVDIIFGTHNLHRFPELLVHALQGESIVEIWDEASEVVEDIPIKRESELKAFVTIMHGCNNFCSYCIVPYTRGRERSRTVDAIVGEIKSLVAEGYKEITLLGQNVNSYGKDLEDMNFAKLLRIVNEIEGLERIRYMSSHPKDLTDDVIEAMKDCDKVCEQVHLPVQSGSTRLLKKMNRKYSKEDYLALVDRIKSAIPGVTLTTDIIVGFPGETEEDFADTLDLVNKVVYDSAFTFIYSIREGTPAAKYEDQVDDKVKHERFNRLVAAMNDNSIKINNSYKDKIVEVLVEGTSKNDSTKLMGRTRGGKLVNFDGADDSVIGKLVLVKIIQPQTWSLTGEFVEVVR
ncbi:tRNA (N6-isopentenyl adenosine(37)-C2)-methylthiotransferase MiaB [Clostridium cylindrosporum]|uniref:tRNA (N6-isopentenyl adenosine(37)-C2)-methylthiotransferase MiaB n=1 Tax=Clostridium cylindrosporum TaxID=1495 RepID=UPI00065C69DF|nr:tRNA (N6-isopentenyl adenosine(37)-C2)-methylthiotransferase MiaB [Clostridium cylindrosporum]